MRANRNFHIAAIAATALFFVWFQAAVAETPVQEQLGALVQVHPECEEALSIVENSAPVPQTGQTVPDPGSDGDDGDLQMGVPWEPASRFTDNQNGTVTDNLTGLIWLKNANCFEYIDWYEALDASNSLAAGQCGLSDGSSSGDWRLPNVRELHSLVDFGEINPALPAEHPFTEVQSGYYWSSTTVAGYPDVAWYVYMDYGIVYPSNKDYHSHVWPVRGGN